MPVYLNSMVYLFGVLLLSTLVMLILTGIILAIFGPSRPVVKHNRPVLSLSSLLVGSVVLLFPSLASLGGLYSWVPSAMVGGRRGW